MRPLSFFFFFVSSLLFRMFGFSSLVPDKQVTSGLCFAPPNGMEMGEMTEQNSSPDTKKKVLPDGSCVVGL